MTLPDLVPTDLPWLFRAHAWLLGVVLVVLGARVASGRASWRVALAVGVALAAWSAVTVAWIGPALPVGAFHPVREGFGLHHLQEVAGQELDAGPLQDVLWRPLLVPGEPSLRTLVTSHVVLAGWAAILFAGLCAQALAWRPLAVALPLGAALSAGWLTAATSEIAATVSGLYELVGAGLFVVAVDRAERWSVRGLAVVGLGGIGVALLFVRPELLALDVAVGVALLGAVVASGIDDRLDRAAHALLGRAPWVVPALLVGWLLVAWAIGSVPTSRLGEPWRWVADGLHPLNPHVLTLPIALLGLAPAGLVVLAVRGTATSLVRPVRTGLLALVVLGTYATMWTAAHGPVAVGQQRAVAPWELYRYLLGLLPLVWLLALLGALRWQHARWRGALALACVLPAIPEAAALLGPVHPAGWPRIVGFERSSQAEVRALVARAEAAPACGIVAPVRPWRAGRGEIAPTWAALRPWDHGFRVVTSTLPASEPAARAVALLMPDVPCALAWRGLDCAVVGGTRCTGLDGLRERAAIVVVNRPDVHPQHGAGYGSAIELGWLEIPGVPADPPTPGGGGD